MTTIRVLLDKKVGIFQAFDGARLLPVLACLAGSFFITKLLYHKLRDQNHAQKSLLYWHGVFMCMNVTFVFVNLTTFLHVPDDPLYDVGFHILPEIPPDYKWISEALVLSPMAVWFALMALLHEGDRWQLVNELARVQMVTYAVRCTTVFWTLLPGPAMHCRLTGYHYLAVPKT